MSTRQVGNARENRVIAFLEALGYYCYPSRGSRGIDIVALSTPEMDLPYLGIEAGGRSKSVRLAFSKLADARVYPGMRLLVVREVKVRNRNTLRWHWAAGCRGSDSFFQIIEQINK